MFTRNINIESNINTDPLCVTIGNFDGIHKGHQFVIKKLIKESKKLNLLPTVLSFNPHPSKFFKRINKNFNILLEDDKEDLLKSLGVKIYYKLIFNEITASLSAQDFINIFLIDKLKMRSLVIGENFRFGKNRDGNIDLLNKLSIEKNFSLHIIKSVKLKDSSLIHSSSVIRKNIEEGNFNNTNKFLGRPWTIRGIVQEGDKRARQMNFPTANIFVSDIIIPKKGVYIVKIILGEKKYSGIANFGRRPTFNGKKILLEVNIFDFHREIYGKELTVEFLTFIREEIKFDNFDELKKQVNKDVLLAKSFFDNNK